MVKAPGLDTEGSGFKSRFGAQLFLLEIFAFREKSFI